MGRVHSKNKTPVLGNAIQVLDVKLKAGVERILVIFQDRSTYVCSAISFKRSRRELSIDVAERRSILKNDHNTHYSRFSFISKTNIAFPKTGILFLLCSYFSYRKMRIFELKEANCKVKDF